MGGQEYIDLVIYLSTDWKSNSSGTKGYFGDVFYIRALAKLPGIRILCVNQPYTPVETSITKTKKAVRWLRGNRSERIGDNLFLYTPFAFVHDMLAVYSPSIQRMNRAVVSHQVKKQLAVLGFNSPLRVSMIYHPLQYTYFGIAGEKYRIYKSWDLYRIRDYPAKVVEVITVYEKLILESCDAVLTPCVNLYREIFKKNSNTYFIPGGVDPDLFRKTDVGHEPIPPDMVAIKNPRIGFSGNINEKVDMHLLKVMAESHPEWSIVVIGNISGAKSFLESDDYRDCRNLQNIHFLGFKDFESLPSYINAFDVCILAHSNIESMQYAHPYKTLQYLAVGKPVVSTDFPDARYYKDVIQIAKNTDEFISLVEHSLLHNTPEQMRKRLDFVGRNTWDTRAGETYDILLRMIHSPNLPQAG